MTITYAYFRGNRSYNNGRLSKVHAFKDTHIDFSNSNIYYPICYTTIDRHGSDRISIIQKDIKLDDLCKLCRNYLIKEGEKWFLEPCLDFSNNRGDSLDVNISRETTEKIVYNLGDYTLTVTLFGGEFSSGVFRDNRTQRTITILSDVNLLQLFILPYKALEYLDMLPNDVIESIEQFIYDNKNK